MKSRLFFHSLMILVVLFLGNILGAGQTSGDNPPDLEVVKWEWQDIGLSIMTDVTLWVKHTGSKTITAVNYSVYYIDSIRDNRVIDKLTLRTDDKPIKPGKEKTFRKVFDCCHHPSNIKAKLVITRVEYDDGTYWEIEKLTNSKP